MPRPRRSTEASAASVRTQQREIKGVVFLQSRLVACRMYDTQALAMPQSTGRYLRYVSRVPSRCGQRNSQCIRLVSAVRVLDVCSTEVSSLRI